MPQVIVEFVPDYSKLESGLDQLANSGAISKDIANAFKDAQKPIDDLARKMGTGTKSITRDLDSVRNKLAGISKSAAEGFREGMSDALKEAGVSLEEFENKLKQVTAQDKTLKQELKEVTVELAKLKLAGQENTKQYQELINRAGQLRDTLSDVAAETRRVGSDTRRIDTVIEIVQGLGAAYQIAQGAAALLGRDNAALQEGLLRLQAIMAITNGIQQVGNLLQKESNAIRLISLVQTRAHAAAINLQTAAQSRNVVVSGAATVAMRLLNTVMKANPALLLVSAFAALAGALSFFGNSAKAAERDAAALNTALARQKELLDNLLSGSNVQLDIELEKLKQKGATEEELHQARQKFYSDDLNDIRETIKSNIILANSEGLLIKNRESAIAALQERQNILDQHGANLSKASKTQIESHMNLIQSIIDGYKQADDQANKIRLSIESFDTGQAEKSREQEKRAAEDAKRAAEQATARAREAGLLRLTDAKAVIEAKLLAEREGSEEFLRLQVLLAEAEKNIGVFNAKSLAEKELAIAHFLAKADQLTTDFYNNDHRKALQAQADTLTARLQNLNLEAVERERLTIALMEKQRLLELDLAEGNKEKEKEINARFDKEISEARLAIREKELDDELRLIIAKNGVRVRALQAASDNEKLSLEDRLNAVRELEAIEIAAIEKKKIANQRFFEEGLISQQQFNITSEELKDQEAQVHENAEKKKTDITESESEKRKGILKDEINQVLRFAEMLATTIGSITSTISERERTQIEDNRRALEDLMDAGTITEKEFEQRMRRLDIADRNAKRKAAEREKAVQLFQAFIAGARAIVEAAPNPFLIALTAALVGAQIAAIAARPIPKFGRGTKSAPKGLAEVGETGAEIIHTRDGRYFVADHPQVIWMKGGERIYNPKETEAILSSQTPAANRSLTESAHGSGATLTINEASLAKKIGEEIARHPRNVISMDERGFTRHLQHELYSAMIRNKQFTFHD